MQGPAAAPRQARPGPLTQACKPEDTRSRGHLRPEGLGSPRRGAREQATSSAGGHGGLKSGHSLTGAHTTPSHATVRFSRTRGGISRVHTARSTRQHTFLRSTGKEGPTSRPELGSRVQRVPRAPCADRHGAELLPGHVSTSGHVSTGGPPEWQTGETGNSFRAVLGQ